MAARAGLVLDVDDGLNPRQMCRQRSPVDPALVSPSLPLQRRCIIGLRGMVRRGLLDVFETQQHLVLGQRLRPAAKAMPLQFLDDLAQPLVLHPLGEQHRFQRLGIVRQCLTRHHQIRSYSAELCDDLPGS